MTPRAAQYALTALVLFAPITGEGCVVLPIWAMPAEELVARFDAISFGHVIDEKIVDSRRVSVTVVISETIKGDNVKEIVVPLPVDGLLAMCGRPPPRLGENAILTGLSNHFLVEAFDPSSPYAESLRALKKKATSNPTVEPDERKSGARRSP